MIQQAIALHQGGDVKGAIIGYEQYLSIQPDPSVYHNLGVAYAQLEKWEPACQAYEASLRLRPFSIETRNNLGTALMQSGKLFDAEKILRSLLVDEPRNIDVAVNLAGVLLEQGRPDVAIPLLSPLIRGVSQHPIGWDTLGSCFLEIGDLDVALASFARAHQQAPLNTNILFNLFTPLFERDPLQAIALLQHGLKHSPERWDWSFHIHCIETWLTGSSNTSIPKETPKAWIDSWLYMQDHKSTNTQLFTTTYKTLDHAIQESNKQGLCLEFGTRFGTSARMIDAKIQQPLFVFDSFEGLPTDWHSVSKGAYSTNGVVPNLGPNVQPVVGWYSDSLPPFLLEHSKPARFIHIDCDLFSSTKDILDVLHPRLQTGCVLVFDEYLMGPHWKEDEWKAWTECAQQNNIDYIYLGCSFLTRQTTLKIV